MSAIRYQVFVSSTYLDLRHHRQEVINAIMSLNDIPAGMELFPSADENAWEIIKRTIDQSDYYIVIIGGKYGSVDADGTSYTEKEYDYAAEKGIPIMAFLHERPASLPCEHNELDSVARERLSRFREKVEQRHCNYWRDETDLSLKVVFALSQAKVNNPRVGWIRGDEAKTKEDAEYVASLERKVRDLENQVMASHLSDKEFKFMLEEFQDEVELYLTGGDGHECTFCISRERLFWVIGVLLLQGRVSISIEGMSLDRRCWDFLGLPCSADRHLVNSYNIKDFGVFLALRGLIEIENSYSNPWRLRDKGNDFLLYIERQRRGSW